jgi:hypothetical protein
LVAAFGGASNDLSSRERFIAGRLNEFVLHRVHFMPDDANVLSENVNLVTHPQADERDDSADELGHGGIAH